MTPVPPTATPAPQPTPPVAAGRPTTAEPPSTTPSPTTTEPPAEAPTATPIIADPLAATSDTEPPAGSLGPTPTAAGAPIADSPCARAPAGPRTGGPRQAAPARAHGLPAAVRLARHRSVVPLGPTARVVGLDPETALVAEGLPRPLAALLDRLDRPADRKSVV